jgi:hypothetical protein
MNKYILFVFEGEKTEKIIIDNLNKVFFNADKSNIIIYTAYKAEIFQLWNEIKSNYDFNNYLDLVTLLKNRGNNNLQGITDSMITETHLFFDHDAHSHLGTISINDYNNIIREMLNYFNNEGTHGKLWISYPMVESVKHFKRNINKCFINCLYEINKNTDYKHFIAKASDYLDLRKLTIDDWHYFIVITAQKLHCLLHDIYKMPDYTEIKDVEQMQIHEIQINKFINPELKVAVISAFPLFLLYYYGEPMYKKAISQKNS